MDHPTSSPLSPRFCYTCQHIPFVNFFDRNIYMECDHRHFLYSHRIDHLDRIIERSSSCPFCHFIVQVWELLLLSSGLGSSYALRTHSIYCEIQKTIIPFFYSRMSGIGMLSIKNWENSDVIAEIRFGLERPQSTTLDWVEPQQHIFLSQLIPEGRRHQLPRCRSSLEATSGLLNFDIIRDWLSYCCSQHPCNTYHHVRRAGDPGLYLIDIGARKVVLAPPGARYIALSYVWGERPTSPGLSQVDGITFPSSLPGDLPQTIEDACQIAQKLGVGYLWVDVYCINQQDEAGKQRQIENMDEIYANAFLTVVAASGVDSSSGIAGISRPIAPASQPTISTPYGTLMATFWRDLCEDFVHWPWSKRAWTLQEEVLSERLLLLADQNYSMRCRRGIFLDVLPADSPRYDTDRGLGLAGDLFNAKTWLFMWYAEKISHYTSRKMSDHSDILNAFTGLFNRITRNCGVVFSWGVPDKDTVSALLWSPHPRVYLNRRAGFPSWAWCGWTGNITYPIERWGRKPGYPGYNHVVVRDAKVDLPNDSTRYAQTLRIASSIGTFQVRVGAMSQTLNVETQQCLFHLDGRRVNLVGYLELGLRFDELESSNNSEEEVKILFLRRWSVERGEQEPPSPFQGVDLVTCLLIKPHGIAWRRIGIATIPLEDWEMANPRNVTVNLE